MIDAPQRTCSAFTGASQDRNSGITGSTYSQMLPFMPTGSAEHVRQPRTGVVRRAVIDSGGCGWRKREARVLVLAKYSVQATGSPARNATPVRPATTQCGQVLLVARNESI